GERAQPPRAEPAERRQTPAHDQDEPETFQEPAERLGRRKGERGALLAQDPIVGVELRQTAQRLSGRQPGADPEPPEPARHASDEPDAQPAPATPSAHPRGADEHRQGGNRRQRVVLVLEPREREEPDDRDQPDDDDGLPSRSGRSIGLTTGEDEDAPGKGP